MSIPNSKSSITNFPTYLDGYFDTFKVIEREEFPRIQLELDISHVPYEQLSINDRNVIEARQLKVNLSQKIRVQQFRELDSLLFIRLSDGSLHKVFNIYHFRNKQGFPQSDITLEKYDKEVVFID